jgi:hypothetical protein
MRVDRVQTTDEIHPLRVMSPESADVRKGTWWSRERVAPRIPQMSRNNDADSAVERFLR